MGFRLSSSTIELALDEFSIKEFSDFMSDLDLFEKRLELDGLLTIQSRLEDALEDQDGEAGFIDVAYSAINDLIYCASEDYEFGSTGPNFDPVPEGELYRRLDGNYPKLGWSI